MRSSLLIAGIVAVAHAWPFVQRDAKPEALVVTETNVVNVWVTVTEGVNGASATPAAQTWTKGSHGKPHPHVSSLTSTVQAQVVVTVTATAAAAATTTPVDTPTVEPTDTPTATPTPEVPFTSAAIAAVAPTTSPADTPAPAATQAPAPVSADQQFINWVLDHHNVHRQNHTVVDLVWNQTMADSANQIAQTCVYGHSMGVNGLNYGQNIAAGAPENNITAVITELFYNSEFNAYLDGNTVPDPNYPYSNEHPANWDANFEKFGHYTQIVWKGTTSVGCAVVSCPNGLANTGADVAPIFTVCNYYPPGNWPDAFADNVLQPKHNPIVPSVHWDYMYNG